jgi:hypothetical protein
MLLRCLELKLPIQRFVRRLQAAGNSNNDDDYNPLIDALSNDD